jgi:hypothetical protein
MKIAKDEWVLKTVENWLQEKTEPAAHITSNYFYKCICAPYSFASTRIESCEVQIVKATVNTCGDGYHFFPGNAGYSASFIWTN